MRKIAYFVMVTLLVSLSFSQTVDEIISKNLKSRGGIEKLRRIKTLMIKGKIVNQSMEMPFVLWTKKPNMVRTEITIQKNKMIQAYDGKNAWWVMPLLNINEPQPMPEDYAKQVKEQQDYDSPFLDYKKKGYKIEFLGKDNLEGTGVYKLKLTKKNGKEYIYYLDEASCIELKMEGTTVKDGKEIRGETIFGDYKEVDGIFFPFSMEMKSPSSQGGSQMIIEGIKINPSISDGFFKMENYKKD